MAQFWRTKKFRELYHTWNKKLEQSGFKDAEVELKNDRALKQRASNAYRQASELERQTRLDYYVLLGHLASQTEFDNEVEKFIMGRHAEGASIKEIVQELQDKDGKHRHTVCHIIRRWQSKWGIKTWTLKQMNLKSIK